jgi:predicted ester cyclase
MMEKETNKRVVLDYVDAFNARDYDRLGTLFAPDAVIYGVLGSGGLDVVMPLWRELHTGLGVRLHVERISADGDSVAVLYTERGRFDGPFLKYQPTGKTFEATAMEWFIVRHGKIQQRWGVRDSATIARQVGIPFN